MKSTTPKAAFFCESNRLDYVYRDGRHQLVGELCDLLDTVITSENFDDHVDSLAEIEVIFSTWGMPALNEERIEKMKNLKAIFYGAGAVKHFARPYLARDIKVISAWAANAVPVAEFVLAQSLLAFKGFYRNTAECRKGMWRGGKAFTGPGVYDESLAIIGAGMVGRKLIELLKPYNIDILVVDPFLPQEEADAMGVEIVELAEAFKRAFVVSNHLPNLEKLCGVLNAELFETMREGAVFINTGRGAQVNEDDLIKVFTERDDLTALLDVTHPEPPVEGSPLYDMPNIHLSSHIAGSLNNEVARLADCVIEEFKAWRDGKPLKYAINAELLERMA